MYVRKLLYYKISKIYFIKWIELNLKKYFLLRTKLILNQTIKKNVFIKTI